MTTFTGSLQCHIPYACLTAVLESNRVEPQQGCRPAAFLALGWDVVALVVVVFIVVDYDDDVVDDDDAVDDGAVRYSPLQ
ncbi:Metabotropic glutamate receptor 4, partial [Frankliniella fusca]